MEGRLLMINKKIWSQYSGILYLIILIVGSLLLVKFILPYFTPFVIALLIACLIDPIVDFIENRTKLSRGIAVFLVLGVLLVIGTVLLTIGIARIVKELEDLAMALPKYDNIMRGLIMDLINKFVEMYTDDTAPVMAIIQDNVDKIYDTLRLAVNTIMGMLKFIPALLVILIISFIATYFISRDKEIIVQSLLNLAPKEWRRKALIMKSQVVKDTMGFIRAQFILTTINTLIAIIGLKLIGVRFFFVLGIIIGLLDFIPTIGPGLIFVPWAIFDFLMDKAGEGIYILILYGVILLVRQAFQAVILGENIGVHPLLALISIYIGIKVFGVVGCIIGPLVAVVLKAVIGGTLPSLIQK